MAKSDGQTLERLYIELGLDLSKLQADILAADKTVTENLGRLNRERNIIKLRMEADIASFDAVKDATKILEIREKALNQQLTLTTDRMKILETAYKQVAKNSNSTAYAVNKAEQAFLREKIAVGQLQQQLKELASQKLPPAPTNSLLSGYLDIKGNISGKINELTSVFNQLKGATSSADSALTATLGVIGEIPHPVGKAIAALASMPIVIKGIENSFLDMSKAAIAAGDAVYVMSRGMQMSIADTAKLSTIAKVTGIDINEVNSSLRRLSIQITKGGEKGSLILQTLQRYGAEITDETGRIKNELELAEEVGKALKNAQIEGNGAAFRNIVGGKFWSGDFITFLEDFADNSEAAAKIVKNGLANPALAHAVQGNINTMNTQVGQLNAAFSSALMPVVNEIVPRTTERLGELTKVIAANKENIKFLGDAIALPIRVMNEFTDSVISLSNAIDVAKGKETTLGKIFESLGQYRDDVAALMNVAPLTALTTILSPIQNATGLAVNFYRDEIEDYKRLQDESARSAQDKAAVLEARKANTLALNKANLEAQQKLKNALASTEERQIKNVQEAEDIIYKIRHSNYENSLRDLKNWEEEQLQVVEELNEIGKNVLGQENLFDDEILSVQELAAAKRLQIEEEKEQKLAEIRQRIMSAEKTELENRMIAIEDEKDSWIAAGMEKAEAEKLAQKELVDYIKNEEKELSDSLQSLYGTELENRLTQIEKERQAWIDKCGDEVKATRLAEQAKADAQRSAAMSVLKQQAQEYEAYQKGGYAGLRAYKAAQLEEQGIKSDYLYMTPEQLADFQKANQVADKSMLPNFMTDHDRAEHYQQMQNWRDFQAQRNAELDSENYAIVDGIKVGLSEVLKNTPLKIEIGKNDKYETHSITVSPEGDRYSKQDDKYSYDQNGQLSQQDTMTRQGTLPTISEPPEGYKLEDYSQLPQAVQGITESLSEMPQAVQAATESLNELPSAVQSILENMPEVEPPTISQIDTAEITQSLSELSPAVQSATDSLSELPAAVQSISEQISNLVPENNLPSVLSGLEQNFSQLPTVIQTASDSLNELPMTISDLKENLSTQGSQLFSPMSETLTTVTVKINGFATSLDNFLQKLASANITAEQKTPVNVSTTVQIDEAHAWDYDHIQELAEKVAAELQPKIIRAIGGDSNSY